MHVALEDQFVKRRIELQPLAEATGQLAFFFQVFENLEILPDGVVFESGKILGRSDPPLGQVSKRGFDSLPSLVVVGLWDHGFDGSTGSLAKNASGLAIRVAIDLPALWIFAGQRDARQLQRPSIRYGNVTVHALEKDRMSTGNLVEIPATGHSHHRPQRFIPSATCDPLAGRSGLHPGQNTVAKLLE